MLVFWRKGLVFFAIPKTGTTALEAALQKEADAAILNPPGMKHCSVAKYRRELSGFFEQKGKRPLEKVAIVREPLSWLGSWYRYRQRPALAGHANSTANVSFEAFVEAWLQDHPPAFAKVGQQARFLDAVGTPARIEHLFAYEHIDRAVAFFEERLGCPVRPERMNVSPAGAITFSEALRAEVLARRPDEFALWEQARAAG